MDHVAAAIVEHARAAERHRRRAALRAVASLELLKGVVVLLLGFGAVSMVHKDAWDMAEALLRFLRVDPDHHHYAQVFLDLADNVTDRKLWALAGGAAAYSIVRFVEAYGLWRERTWAEWFALISGALYVPFETYELIRRPDCDSRCRVAHQSRHRLLHDLSEIDRECGSRQERAGAGVGRPARHLNRSGEDWTPRFPIFRG